MSLDQITYLPLDQQEKILDGPSLEPPPGVIPNFDNPPSNNPLAHGVLTLCLVLAVFAALIRGYAKLFCARKVRIEDYIAFAAFGNFIGFMYISYYRFSFLAAFSHQWDVRVRDLYKSLYILHIGSNLYAITMMLVKVAILREWCRIFVPVGTRNKFYYTCYGLMAFNIAFFSAAIIATNLACRPYQKNWDKTIPGGKCFDPSALQIASAIINLVSDIIVLILPQRVIWTLHLSSKKKAGISVVFAVGILACVAGACRLATSTKFLWSDDTIYNVTDLTLWTIAEMTCAFLIFCAPCVPKAFAGEGPISRVAASVKSWTGGFSGKRTNVSSVISRQPNSKTSIPGNVYRKIRGNDIPLQRREAGNDSVSDSTKNLGAANLPRTGIIRTTHFGTHEDYVGGDTGSKGCNPQHSWDVEHQ